MTQPYGGRDEPLVRVLDSLRITPQHFLDAKHNLGREARSIVDKIDPVLTRAKKGRYLFEALWEIDVDVLDKKLRAALDPLGVGYSYAIRRGQTIVHSHSSGWAQLPNDGQVGWALHIPMNVASVSKFVTAIALIRLLRETGISVKSPIAAYLPQYWTQGAGSSAITFHNLLRHEAGLGFGITDTGMGNFAEAKSEIEKGTTKIGARQYKNVNFAILRVLFATVTGTVSPSATVPAFLGISDDVAWDVVSAAVYRDYVNDNVFAPASISARDFSADANAAKAYATPPMAAGAVIEDGPGGCGQSGWHLNIGELIRLMSRFRGGSMMSRSRAQKLMSDMYGLDPPFQTAAGPVYTKGGRKLMGTLGFDSAIYMMPGDTDLAIFVNSWGHLNGIAQLIVDSVEFGLSVVLGKS